MSDLAIVAAGCISSLGGRVRDAPCAKPHLSPCMQRWAAAQFLQTAPFNPSSGSAPTCSRGPRGFVLAVLPFTSRRSTRSSSSVGTAPLDIVFAAATELFFFTDAEGVILRAPAVAAVRPGV